LLLFVLFRCANKIKLRLAAGKASAGDKDKRIIIPPYTYSSASSASSAYYSESAYASN
jgi:hypothetical protein